MQETLRININNDSFKIIAQLRHKPSIDYQIIPK